MKTRLILATVAAGLVLAGCDRVRIAQTEDFIPNGPGSQIRGIDDTSGLSQTSFRYYTKTEMVVKLCSLQSDNHNDQRKTASVEVPQAVYSVSPTTGAVVVTEGPSITFNAWNPAIPPFDMANCIAEGTTGQWARFLTFLSGKLLDVAKSAIPYGAGYLVLDRAFNAMDDPSIQVLGDDNRVAGPGAQYDERPGVNGEDLRGILNDQSDALTEQTEDIIDALEPDDPPTVPDGATSATTTSTTTTTSTVTP